MNILHISAECYPAAKAGGLGDVVGALPKYLNDANVETSVVIPGYHTKWLLQQDKEAIFRSELRLHHEIIPFSVEAIKTDDLGFPLYIVNIPGKFDREGVYMDPSGYSYGDELERALSFQIAVLQWISSLENKPSVLHCHDHHTGLIPFFLKYAFEFKHLRSIPTVFTIHNGEYPGAFGWKNIHLLPPFDSAAGGLLDWGDAINPLACAIKCCWKLTTVSPGYMEELRTKPGGLNWLLNNERSKSIGVLNGIDTQTWDPKKDTHISHQLKRSLPKFKETNKATILEKFNVKADLPLITFIGRLAREKGADLIPTMITQFFNSGHRAAFILLGSGDPHLQMVFQSMKHAFEGYFDCFIGYNETLAHQLYAGSDFLFMPSRVEPCGLNQMYAFRYGTIPIVRSIGGLKDTVLDIGEENGRGIRFDYPTADDGSFALYRAHELYKDQKAFKEIRNRITKLDFSWERSAKAYATIYSALT